MWDVRVLSFLLASAAAGLLTNSPTGSGKGVDCIRSLSSEVLIKANTDIITSTAAPFLGPGPTIDGNLVPDLPNYLLAQGRFHKDITILVSDDINEVCPPAHI